METQYSKKEKGGSIISITKSTKESVSHFGFQGKVDILTTNTDDFVPSFVSISDNTMTITGYQEEALGGETLTFDLTTLILKKGDSKGNNNAYFFTDGTINFTFRFTHENQKRLADILDKKCRKFDFKSNYDCIKLIGSGSYAKVFECKSKDSFGRKVAVKVYDKDKFYQKETHKVILS